MKTVPLVWLSLCLALGCVPGAEGPSDAGSLPDVGEDAGTGADAGASPDAGTAMDGGTGTDAGTAMDGGTGTDAGTSPCDFLGDPSGTPSFTPTAIGPDKVTSSPVEAGGTISILLPFQGGRVLFIGVRDVINMDPCGVTLLGALRDVGPAFKSQLDQRTVNLLRGPDGKGATDDLDLSTFSNVTLCPNQWSTRDLYDQEYELIVSLTDKNDRVAYRSLKVRPACNVADERAECRCICKKGYILGSSCP